VEGNHYGGIQGSLFKHKREIKVLRPDIAILLDTNRRIYVPGNKGRNE
jgi:hypothetical protein